jgi:hypothetical protein
MTGWWYGVAPREARSACSRHGEMSSRNTHSWVYNGERAGIGIRVGIGSEVLSMCEQQVVWL